MPIDEQNDSCNESNSNSDLYQDELSTLSSGSGSQLGYTFIENIIVDSSSEDPDDVPDWIKEMISFLLPDKVYVTKPNRELYHKNYRVKAEILKYLWVFVRCRLFCLHVYQLIAC